MARLDAGDSVQRNRFGTFAGVFTPSILTILGVIMFTRAGFVVGEAGIGGALVILCLCEAIVLLTAVSISAIATNTHVRGGGAYFLISRVLGPQFGTTSWLSRRAPSCSSTGVCLRPTARGASTCGGAG